MFKHIILSSALLISLSSYAKTELLVGDILLQPTDCWSCTLIEEEHNSIYSHMGLVMQTEPELLIAESLGKVRVVPFAVFNSKTEKGQKLMVMRYNNPKLVEYFSAQKAPMMNLFKSEFEGKEYDKEFLWNNFNANGAEKLYCSEFTAKFLQAFVGLEPMVRKMHFTKNLDLWARYFKGNIPDGKWGNAPSDYHESDLLHEVGEL